MTARPIHAFLLPEIAPVTAPHDRRPFTRALISVSDKTGLVPIAEKLVAAGIALLSTGGTARALREAGLDVTDVAEVTGFPEIMGGRVKTLHPRIHGGLLGDRAIPSHREAMDAHGIADIDLLIVNLYPFEAALEAGKEPDALVEEIDIGGPAMIRAASKNHAHLTVITDTEDYVLLEKALTAGGTTLAERRSLAATAFARTAAYDAAIAGWLEGEAHPADAAPLPRRVSVAGTQILPLRYGENPHQRAALYRTAPPHRPGIVTARQHQGKALSYNNINDGDAAIELVAEFEEPAVAIIKHANPCGVATGPSVTAAYERALACDPVSAFGGIVALNRPLDRPTAERITEIFTEIVIAPGLEEGVEAVFAKKKNLRLLTLDAMPDPTAPRFLMKPVAGGFLFGDADLRREDPALIRTVTEKSPSPQEMRDLLFAFTVAKHVKSNAIVYAKGGASVAIGAGQMSRLDSTRIAVRKSQDAAEAMGASTPLVEGSVVASDAFFPFADGLIAAAEAGATAVIQPGGSIRDEEVIAAANARGLAMVFTGQRHFRH
ncbi:AICARFT/IMPCHase bienzyme [Parvularcula bermudensis HTCC2503]|uniref:Bifunctional purine biosynthesis protein PurH n=1 Tax=Parvularcula bermudensis (strain ATCC BAA-594 / HTCC2503 / KCTC 12087) TaxID=314260 RepID=E0TD01_PARBH|nr:bifunctional phosphoribosylaminoimidazolecarboxamide formyltransferase/IMP cyclohydrolase [Parvularcula bermudensis]ADM08660.1 AICARFT/IMPCHase bienzyme [Parvularcula bermudensis HTCC2503]